MFQEVLFLLLPVAALSGWLIGKKQRKSKKQTRGDDCPSLSHDYFQGLNYLLNEQSDKALEVFIQMSEVDSDTIELHFTLANLFAKRGEVDRAIRIHQNLIARPMLSREERNRALFELAKDYMRAGLLDRAESLFGELVEDAYYGQQSRWQLLDIFQQEKEWEKAIQIARRLKPTNGRNTTNMLAHYYCEQAEDALQKGDSSASLKLLKRAYSENRHSIRATLLESQIHIRNHNTKAAIKSLRKMAEQNNEYLPLVLEPLKQAYELADKSDEYVAFLKQQSAKGSFSSIISLSEQLQLIDGDASASELLSQSLHNRPSLLVLKRLLEIRLKDNQYNTDFELALNTIDRFLMDKPVYHCENCGYSSRTMHWQCPSCKQWDRVKPIHGIEGD